MDASEFGRDILDRVETETHPAYLSILSLVNQAQSLLTANWSLFDTPEMAPIQASLVDALEAIQREAGTLAADARHRGGVITLAEAERRWRKTNLRQNKGGPRRWKMGREWWTSRREMEAAYGPEPNEWEAAYDKAGRS